MKRLNRRLAALAVLVIAFLFGFLQERVKIEMNFILEQGIQVPAYDQMTPAARAEALDTFRLDHPSNYYYSHGKIPFFTRFTLGRISALKWAFAGVFMLVNLIMVWLMFSWWTGYVMRLKWLVLLYAGFGIAAVGIYGVGSLLGSPEASYGLARKILGALQSPVPIMILVPAYKLIQVQAQSPKS